MDAMRWLGRVARITAELRMSDADRLIVATHFLGGEVETWWDGVQADYLVQTSWDDFLREFREQYPAPRQRAQLIMDFYQLA